MIPADLLRAFDCLERADAEASSSFRVMTEAEAKHRRRGRLALRATGDLCRAIWEHPATRPLDAPGEDTLYSRAVVRGGRAYLVRGGDELISVPVAAVEVEPGPASPPTGGPGGGRGLSPALHARLSRLVERHDRLVSRAEGRTGQAWQRLADRINEVEDRIRTLAVRAGIGLCLTEFRDDRTVVVAGGRAIVLERNSEHVKAGKGPALYVSVCEVHAVDSSTANPPPAAPTRPVEAAVRV
jgi:hypothetical protein